MDSPPLPSPDPTFAPLQLDDLGAAARGRPPWLWHGYLAPGHLTLLVSQWKSGKTTLVAVLLSRLGTGGTLAGLPLTPGKAAVVSEENPALWYMRSRKLTFGGHVCWFCRPFPKLPTPEQWAALVDRLVGLHAEHGISLVVIDPLASFLPARTENSATDMLAALAPLQRLTSRGVAVLVLHHPRKGELRPGQAARGSGALPGYADIVVEMSCFGRPTDPDRRRRLDAYSRYDETPRRLVIELAADGTDYLARPELADAPSASGWETLRAVLAEAGTPLTRRDLRARWPAGAHPPNDVTLWRWLEEGLHAGRLVQTGTGRRGAPFRFALAERPAGAT